MGVVGVEIFFEAHGGLEGYPTISRDEELPSYIGIIININQP